MMLADIVLLALLFLSVAGHWQVSPWFILGMYLLNRLSAPGGERKRDEDGFEAGDAGQPSAGFSLVQGRRPYMEDFIFSSFKLGGGGGGDSTCFFGCFDGHCGKRAAIWAKENLAHNVEAELSARAPKEALQRAFLKTDADFLERAWRENLNDGCTVTTALLVGKDLYVANAGDSRTILCHSQRDGMTMSNATPLSIDHKPDRPSERQRITAAGGTVTFLGCPRVNGVLATSRGFGDKELKRWVTAEPEIQHRCLSPGDDYLVLATDGLWDVLSNQQVANIVIKQRSPQAAARQLTAEALRLGSMDNVSSLVVDLRSVTGAGAAGTARAATVPAPVNIGSLDVQPGTAEGGDGKGVVGVGVGVGVAGRLGSGARGLSPPRARLGWSGGAQGAGGGVASRNMRILLEHATVRNGPAGVSSPRMMVARAGEVGGVGGSGAGAGPLRVQSPPHLVVGRPGTGPRRGGGGAGAGGPVGV